MVNEIRSHWATQQCGNILRLLEIYEDPDFVFLVSEYQKEGSLGSFLSNMKEDRNFTENEVKFVMEQILLSLDFLHQRKIIHRDLKLDNILVANIERVNCHRHYEIQLADLGLSVHTPGDEKMTQICGTPGFIAPEIFESKGYTYKSDLFSVGCCLYALFTAAHLFKGSTLEQVI